MSARGLRGDFLRSSQDFCAGRGFQASQACSWLSGGLETVNPPAHATSRQVALPPSALCSPSTVDSSGPSSATHVRFIGVPAWIRVVMFDFLYHKPAGPFSPSPRSPLSFLTMSRLSLKGGVSVHVRFYIIPSGPQGLILDAPYLSRVLRGSASSTIAVVSMKHSR